MESNRIPDSCTLTAIIVVFATILCRGKSADELNVLGNAIVAVGGLILVWAARQSAQDSQTPCRPASPAVPNP